MDKFSEAKVGRLHGRDESDSTRPGCIVVGCNNERHPVCEEHFCCELCLNPFAGFCPKDDFGGQRSRTLDRALYAAAFEQAPTAPDDVLWASIPRGPKLSAWARSRLAAALEPGAGRGTSLVVQGNCFVKVVRVLADEYIKKVQSIATEEAPCSDAKAPETDTRHAGTGKLRMAQLEVAVAEFLADHTSWPLLVGRQFSCVPDDKWSHVSGQKLKFALCNTTGGLFLISCSAKSPHGRAVAELVRQVGNFVAFHSLSTHVAVESDTEGTFVAGHTHAPGVVISHKPAGAGIAATSLIIEVEVGNRTGPELVALLKQYAAAPNVAYLMGIKVYQERDHHGHWAAAAVLWKANDPNMQGAWSFGTRDVSTAQKDMFRAGSPPELATATAVQIAFAHSVGPLLVTVAAAAVVANHPDPAVAAAIQAAVDAVVVAPGFVVGELTIDLAEIRTILEETLP